MSPHSPDQTLVVNVVPGEVLDNRWRIEHRIGQGAMGSVYRGTDVTKQRPIAIKILAPEHARKPKVLARFEREAELLTSLRHPNIVQIYGHGRRGVLPYIAMEYLEGQTLGDIVTHLGGSLGINETVAVVEHIAAGLNFLHDNELVHRDVKPQNIFVVAGGRITILDLGVVRDQGNRGLTKPGAMVGTPYYMSPEQILGLDDVDNRSDVYALAAMTFELLTGRPPYLGSNNFEVLYGHRNAPVPDASLITKGISKEVATVLVKGMSKQRTLRHASVSEFVEKLSAAANSKRVDLGRAFAFLDKRLTPAKHLARVNRANHVTADGSELQPNPGAMPVVTSPPKVVADVMLGVFGDDEAVSNTELPIVGAEEVISAVQSTETQQGDEGSDPWHQAATIPPDREATFVGVVPELTPEAPERTPGPSKGSAKPPEGLLRVSAQREGDVIVNGRRFGRSSRSFALPPGKHHLRFEATGFHVVERDIEVPAGETYALKLELVPRTQDDD